MWRKSAAQRALALVTAEARRSPAPELDWERLQRRLDAATQQAERVPARSLRALGLALAASGVLAVGGSWWLASPEPPRAVRTAEGARSTRLDGDQLGPERALSARDAELHVVHAGRASWTLERHSKAVVLDHGPVVRIRLDAGSLRASVVPTAERERFVVEAADVRVAVHGTVFRVELKKGQSTVSVQEGVVAVGPRRPGVAATSLLRAPASAEFALDGTALERPTAELVPALPPPAPAARPARPSTHSLPQQPSAPSAQDAPLLPRELTLEEVEEGLTPLVAITMRCFEQHTPSAGNLTIRVRTSMVVDVEPHGEVSSLRFEPPLSPAVQECALSEARLVAFAEASDGTRLTRVLELSR